MTIKKERINFMKYTQKLLMLITIIYLQIIWFLVGVFSLPLFCLARGLNKILECLDEYAKDFTDQYNKLKY